MAYHWDCDKSNMTCQSGVGTAYPTGVLSSPPPPLPCVFSGVCVARSLGFCVEFCKSLFGHCVVFSSLIYRFCLTLFFVVEVATHRKEPTQSIWPSEHRQVDKFVDGNPDVHCDVLFVHEEHIYPRMCMLEIKKNVQQLNIMSKL